MSSFVFAAEKQSPTSTVDFRLFDLPTFRTVGDALTDYTGDDHLYVIYPRTIAAAAQTFLSGFPGTVLYAIKANPHPAVLKTLWNEGIRHFDVASIREVELIHQLFPAAKMFLMHPVKSRALIAKAYGYGIRDFSVDCEDELQKILECTNNAKDLTVHVRLALPEGDADMPLSGKFGADRETAVALLQKARSVAKRLGLCFHVGSQCRNVDNYDAAIGYARSVVDAAAVAIDSIDVGGGFPVVYPEMPIAPMSEFFQGIKASLTSHGFDGLDVLGEPGRALCAEGGSSLVRVELRKGNDLYLNDGAYGSLFDAGQCSWKFPVRLIRDGVVVNNRDQTGFRFFGPTCDSLDVMNGPFHLPSDVREGDWIEVQHLGAYGQALASSFNGFHSETACVVLKRD